MISDAAFDRYNNARNTYNYCGVCGETPKTRTDEPNKAPLRWWDPDDGWKIGSLCWYCAKEVLDAVPKEGDYAFETTNHVCDNENTDEDATEAL